MTEPSRKKMKLVALPRDQWPIVLAALRSQPLADPFIYPVSPMEQGCAHYLEVIKQPMDFSTIDILQDPSR